MAAPAVVGEYAPRGVGGKLYIPEAAAAASDTEEESGSDDDSKSSSDSEAGEGGEGEEEEEEEGDYDGEYGDDSGWWDGDGIYHGDGGDGGGEYRYGDHGYGADGEHMLWTCAVCTVSVNIFARDDHITSRPHIRAVRKLATESAAATAGAGADPAYIPPVWRCAVCVQDMSVFLREEHVLGKEHQRRIRLANGPLDPADLDLRDTAAGEYVSDEAIAAAMVFADTLPPPRFESTEYALRATFYCAVCAGEFDLSSEEQHLDDAETWSCKVCGTAVHAAGQETHEDSDRHKIVAGMQAAQLDAFHCAVCRRFYSPAEKAAHLAGAEHAQMLARVELETQYMLRLEELRKKTAPQAAKGKESQDQGDRQTACNLCREPLMGLSVDRHLQSICPAVMRTGEAQNIPGSVQDRGSCRLCGEPLMGLSAESHRKMFCAAVTRTPGPVKPTPTKPGKKKAPPTKPGKKKAPPNPNVYNCRVCKCGVAMEEKAYHLASETHKKKAAKRARKKAAKFAAAQAAVAQAAAAGLAPPPKPKKGRRRKKKKVYCDVCKTHRSASGIADHMAGQKHQCKLAALQQTGGQNAMPAPPPPPTQEAPSAEPTAPQPAPALSVNYNPAHITIMGDKFHCKMCVRDRLLIGLEDHLRSGGHRRRKAQLAG